MKHGHYFVSLSGATDSDVRDTAGGKSGTAPGKTEEIFALPVEKGRRPAPCGDCEPDGIFFPGLSSGQSVGSQNGRYGRKTGGAGTHGAKAHGAKAPGTITGTDRGSGSHLCGVP